MNVDAGITILAVICGLVCLFGLAAALYDWFGRR